MNINKVWYVFFAETTKKITTPVLFRWSMTNGVVFDMLLPAFEEVKANTFAPEIEFPYTYDEIKTIIAGSVISRFDLNKSTLNELLIILEGHAYLSGTSNGDKISIHPIKMA